MYLAYGAADESGHRARQVYEDWYPNRRIPLHEMFARVHRNLCERGSLLSSMQDTRRRWLTRTVNVAEQVLQSIEDNPNTSTRSISQQLGVSQSSLWRILHEERVHPYHLQRVQLLQPDDYPKVWNLHNGSCRKVPWIPFSRFALAYRWSFIYSWRCVHWTQFTCLDYNPHGTRSHASKHWGNTGIIGDYLLGPYLLRYRLDGRK